MKPRFTFSKSRFTNLAVAAQHKKCAALLRAVVEGENELLETYHSFCSWMKEPKIKEISEQQLLDRFHYHLKAANMSLKEHNFPAIQTEDKATSAPLLPVTIYLDNIRSAHNVGSIVRTTEAMALGSLALSPATPNLNHKQVADSAMGAENWVPWKTVESIEHLQRPLIALETCKDAIPLSEMLFPPSFSLAIGNEEYGCSKKTLEEADYVVSIPLYGRKNSLNVANAFAIAAATITQRIR